MSINIPKCLLSVSVLSCPRLVSTYFVDYILESSGIYHSRAPMSHCMLNQIESLPGISVSPSLSYTNNYLYLIYLSPSLFAQSKHLMYVYIPIETLSFVGFPRTTSPNLYIFGIDKSSHYLCFPQQNINYFSAKSHFILNIIMSRNSKMDTRQQKVYENLPG